MRDLLKWGLIGGGVLFLFKDKLSTLGASTEQPAAASPTLTPAPAPVQQQPQIIYVPAPAPAPQPYPTPSPTAVNVLPLTEDLIKKASYDYDTAVILGNRKLLSTWEWNFYRNEAGRGFGAEDFGEYGDPGKKITAVEYLNRARAKGLAGIRSAPRGLGAIRSAEWRYKHIGN